MTRLGRWFALAALVAGCSGDPEPAALPSVGGALAVEAVDEAAGGTVDYAWLVGQPVADGEVLLAVDARRALLGRPRAALPHADPALALDLRLLGEATGVVLPETPVTWAGFVGDQILQVAPDGRLLLGSRLLDEQVSGAVAARGSRLIYARGDMAEQELFEYDLDTRTRRQLTRGLAPVWSPGIGLAGEVTFASSASGVPALWRLDATGHRQLSNRSVTFPTDGSGAPPIDATPAGFGPIRVGVRGLLFQGHDAQGTSIQLVEPSGRQRQLRADARSPIWLSDDALVIAAGGRIERVVVTP